MQHFGNLEQVETILITPGSGFHMAESSQKQTEESGIVLYVQVDRGLLRTDDGLGETKVGRILQPIIVSKIVYGQVKKTIRQTRKETRSDS